MSNFLTVRDLRKSFFEAGEGITVDRLVMFFTGSPSIRDVILCHLLRALAPFKMFG